MTPINSLNNLNFCGNFRIGKDEADARRVVSKEILNCPEYSRSTVKEEIKKLKTELNKQTADDVSGYITTNFHELNFPYEYDTLYISVYSDKPDEKGKDKLLGIDRVSFSDYNGLFSLKKLQGLLGKGFANVKEDTLKSIKKGEKTSTARSRNSKDFR